MHFWTPHTGENHLSLVMHNHLLRFIQMQLGHNSSQASISWCPGSPSGQSGHNGPIICMPTRKAQSSQCYSVCLIVVSSPGNVGLQQIQHTAYSIQQTCVCPDCGAPSLCHAAGPISPLALGNLHTHTPSIKQHSATFEW